MSISLINLWRQAAKAEIGIAFACSKATMKRAQAELYEARALAMDPALADIRLCLPGDREEIWLVKKTVEVFEL